MTKNEFKTYIQDKIRELVDMPTHGDEFPKSKYVVDGVERIPVFDESEFLDYCADVVRDVYIQAAAFGFVQKQPAKLMSRDEALYCLRQAASFLARKNDERKSVLTPPELAREWGISSDKVRGWIRSGQLRAQNVSDGTRARYQIQRAVLESFRPPVEKPPKPERRRIDPGVTEYY